MSIHAPEYSRAPPVLRPRPDRVLAIWSNQVRAMGGALTYVALAFLYVVSVLTIVLEFSLQDAFRGFLGSVSPLAIFYAPDQNPVAFFFLVLLTGAVGGGIIARDLAARSITLYLARPITALDYLAAKASAVGTYVALGAIVPGLIADLIVLALGDLPLSIAVQAAAGILAVGLLMVVVLTGIAVLCSSLTHRSLLGGAGIFGYLVGSAIVAQILYGVTGTTGILYASVESDQLAVAQAACGVAVGPLDPSSAAVALAGFGVATLALTYVRLLRTEVVAE